MAIEKVFLALESTWVLLSNAVPSTFNCRRLSDGEISFAFGSIAPGPEVVRVLPGIDCEFPSLGSKVWGRAVLQPVRIALERTVDPANVQPEGGGTNPAPSDTTTPILATDVVQFTRGGLPRSMTIAELVAFLGGSVVTPPGDTSPPTITSAASATVSENAAFAMTLAANEAVTWTIVGGADQARFTLSGATLSMAAKDYEAPTDANADNVYVVQVRATDAAGNLSTVQTINVAVTDVSEMPAGNGFSAPGGGPNNVADFADPNNAYLIAALAA